MYFYKTSNKEIYNKLYVKMYNIDNIIKNKFNIFLFSF